MKRFFVLLLICIGMTHAGESTRQTVEKRLEVEVAVIRAQTDEGVNTLRTQYLVALLRLDVQLRRNGDLDGLRAVREEIERVEGGNPLEMPMPPMNGDLVRLQEVVRAQFAEISRKETASLEELAVRLAQVAEENVRTLTRENRIEEALAWREWSNSLRPRIGLTGEAPPQPSPANPPQVLTNEAEIQKEGSQIP